MAITAADLMFHLSGGASNSIAAASIGGARSSVEMAVGVNGLFDVVTGAESASGDTEYRCIYVRNAHATLALMSAVVYISANTPDAHSQLEIGLGTSAINGTEQLLAGEGDTPAGVTFSLADGIGNALIIGDLPAGQHKALWLKRTINAAAPALNNDGATFVVAGDTAE